ncbi:hypothetical protein HW542_12055 [Asaia spathodeae]|uniref:Uncharacterized protein n=1 Tax=Asaia spathodeae TaxID=657016 RepID=A0ABX2P7I0_9PROT
MRSGPFVSDEKKFVFYLTKLEGKQRNLFLGITDDMYKNKEKAKKWYWKISKIIRPDLSKNSDAFNELKKLYDVMINI